jgi:hypothetical protein
MTSFAIVSLRRAAKLSKSFSYTAYPGQLVACINFPTDITSLFANLSSGDTGGYRL